MRIPIRKIIYRAPEGILLAGITGLGYFSSYLSDLGYKLHFQIPSMFVEVHTNSVILSACIIILTLLIAYLSEVINGLNRYGRILFSLLIPASIAVIIGMKVGFRIEGDLWKWILLYLLHCVVFYLFFYSAEKRHPAMLITSVSILIALIISIATWSGFIIAKSQNYFLVSETPSPMVVVDVYDDSLIVAPLDMEKNRIEPEYRFIHLESDINEKMKFKMRDVGPLTVAD
ncbi:hypothetical protein [Paludifilum halophilum]|uniref:Uncharacterized protein n=1 Tax=Paludifilum halophilum TaxID=1642702 RepID=A0A235B9V8_9BACL|nr:hypothetical protein [Paludifilum halophilum]OYD09012.1 hypothetical protein CHM34_04350 [Paludifilum halophilum]